MANVYAIPSTDSLNDFNKSDPNYLLASCAYVISLIKKVEDELLDHINSYDAHKSSDHIESAINMNESIDVKELPIENKTIENIEAVSINTDSTHKFISDTQLSIFKDKVSTFELQSAISNLRTELEKIVNDYFIKLINKEDAVQRIKDIECAISESKDLDSIISLLSGKATKNELNDHAKSIFHLNNNDRKALNLLIKFIEKGCADWNAPSTEPNYIRNKPESLPANGGNADTVGGYKPKDLLNHQAYDIIIGIGVLITNVDFLLPPDGSKNDDLISVLTQSDTKYSHSLMFRSGFYKFKTISLSSHSITGAPNNATKFYVESMSLNQTTLRDIQFKDSVIHIESNVNLENCSFVSSIIYLEASYESTIRNCSFDNCNIVFNGACMDNIITGNRFKKSRWPSSYYGGGNMIVNNLSY